MPSAILMIAKVKNVELTSFQGCYEWKKAIEIIQNT